MKKRKKRASPKRRRVARPQATPEIPVAPPRVGRKTILTQEIIKMVSDKIASVATFRDACLTSGIAEDSGYTWLQRAKDPEALEIYRQFAEAIEEASSRRRMTILLLIRKAGIGTERKPGDWRALDRLGGLTDPGQFIPQVRVHIEGELNAALDRIDKAFSHDPETHERVVQALLGRTAVGQGSVDASGEGPADPAGGEAVHPAPSVPKAEGVP